MGRAEGGYHSRSVSWCVKYGVFSVPVSFFFRKEINGDDLHGRGHEQDPRRG